MKRNIILHAHIFKNAGTTIDWILRRNFGDNFREDRDDFEIVQNANYLNSILCQYPLLQALSSHSLPLPLKQIDGVQAHTIVMLRNPILRVRSVYDFERKQKAQTPGAIFAKKFCFKGYVQWRMQKDVNATIRNMHVNYLTKNINSKGSLASALEYVEVNQTVGIVEKFDASMAFFGDFFSKHGVLLDLSYKKQNVTNNAKESEEEALKRIRCDLGDRLYSTLLEENALDMELYSHAVKLLNRRFQKFELI